MDSVLCNRVRKYLEKGDTLQHIYLSLERQGYARGDIREAIEDYYRDESTDYDDNLIKAIEKRLKKNELIQDIMASLAKEGHTPFEIEKAVLRAEIGRESVPRLGRRWEVYSIIQIFILIVTCGLIFFSWLFILPLLAIISAMVYASMGVPKVNSEWRKEYGMIPGIGLWTRDGIFGYESITGNYWKWRVLDPSVLVSGAFALILFLHLLYTEWSLLFIIICLYLMALSGICFQIKPANASGPPYNLISND